MADTDSVSSAAIARNFGLISLHGAGVTALAGLATWTDIVKYFNVKLALGAFLFGAVCAILQIYYGVVDNRAFYQQLGFEPDPDDGPSTKGVSPEELQARAKEARRRRQRTRLAIAVLTLLLSAGLAAVLPTIVNNSSHDPAQSATNLRVALVLIAVVAAPIPLTTMGPSGLFALRFGRGTLALLSLLAFVVGLSLAAVPSIVRNVADGATAAVMPPDAVSQQGVPGRDGAKGPQGARGHDGKDGRDGRDGRDGKDGAAGRDGKDGKDGSPGRDGVDGRNGKDASGRGPVDVEGRGPTNFVPIPGPQGAPGQPGPKGDQGQKGDTGPIRKCWLGRFYCAPEKQETTTPLPRTAPPPAPRAQ